MDNGGLDMERERRMKWWLEESEEEGKGRK